MTQQHIDQVIDDIKKELPNFSIQEKNLRRFDTTNPADIDGLNYVNGDGGSYIKFLALLTQKMRFKNIVELGNREGYSTLAIFDQLSTDARFTTIDIEKNVRCCPLEMFDDPRVSFIWGDVCSLEILKRVPIDIDFLFCDTLHYYSQIRDEVQLYQYLLADQAIVAIDDIYVNDMEKFWNEISYPKWDLTELCHTSGWGLFLFTRKEQSSKEERLASMAEHASLVWERKYAALHDTYEKDQERKVSKRIKRVLKKYPALYRQLVQLKNNGSALLSR
jgi:predicted O-methyltransferase YrrM